MEREVERDSWPHQMPQSGKEAICCDRAAIGPMASARHRSGSKKLGEIAGLTLVGDGEAKLCTALRPCGWNFFITQPCGDAATGWDDARDNSVSKFESLDINPTMKREPTD
jgi:hypothetical protein